MLFRLRVIYKRNILSLPYGITKNKQGVKKGVCNDEKVLLRHRHRCHCCCFRFSRCCVDNHCAGLRVSTAPSARARPRRRPAAASGTSAARSASSRTASTRAASSRTSATGAASSRTASTTRSTASRSASAATSSAATSTSTGSLTDRDRRQERSGALLPLHAKKGPDFSGPLL